MIYIPGTGILDAYIDSTTGLPNSQFGNALSMYCWAWFILTVVFTVAAMRSSWILFLDLFVLSVELLLLAVGYMTNTDGVLTAANSLGFVVAALSCKYMPLSEPGHCRLTPWCFRLGRLRGTVVERPDTDQLADIPYVPGEMSKMGDLCVEHRKGPANEDTCGPICVRARPHLRARPKTPRRTTEEAVFVDRRG